MARVICLLLLLLAVLPRAAHSSSVCDLALGQLCADSRGTGTSPGSPCISCISSFAHVAALKLAGCGNDELAAFCEPGINRLYATNVTVYHVYPADTAGKPGVLPDITSKNTADLSGINEHGKSSNRKKIQQ